MDKFGRGAFPKRARQRRPGLHSNFTAKKIQPAAEVALMNIYTSLRTSKRESYEFYFGRERCRNISSFFSLTWRGAAEGRFLLSSPFAIQISALEFIALVFLKEHQSSGYLLKITLCQR